MAAASGASKSLSSAGAAAASGAAASRELSLGLILQSTASGRVQVPRGVAGLFAQPEVAISLEAAAKALGFAGVAELKKAASPQLKHFEDAEPLQQPIGALTFLRLVCLCSSKTPAARKLLEEVLAPLRLPGSEAASASGSAAALVSLPALPLAPKAPLPPWPSCNPESVGMDKAPLDRVRRYLDWRTRMKHFAGIVCGIVKNGQTVFYQEAGFLDAESKVRMGGDTIFRLFSMTKCLVAAAFMTYVEVPSNNIDLDDPVAKYIPAFAPGNMSVLPKRGQKENQPLEKAITLRQLLTHTSGIGYGATLDDPWPPAKGSYYKIYEELCERVHSKSIKTLEEWCNHLATVPLKGQPGHCWDYSYSLDVLGRVLEVITGKPLDVVVEERLTGPLKMRDTSFVVPPEKAHRLGPWYKSEEVVGQSRAGHQLVVVDKGGEQSGWVGANASTVLSGGGTVEVPLTMKGGMVSTFHDYMRFLLMLRNFGELEGVRVLRRETVQTMICNHIPAACYGKKKAFVFDKPGLGYSCLGQIQGQHKEQDKGTYPGEYGWGGLAGPAWTIDPRSDLIILSMTQTAFVLDHEEYLRYSARRAIHQFIYGSVSAPAKATSYAPEVFDVQRPKQEKEPGSTEEQTLDKEFEEEHLVNVRTRVRGAKERAIAPGPRLERHPSEDDSDEDDKKLKVPRSSPKPEKPSPNKKAPSPAKEERHELLFKRVAVRGDEEGRPVQKARITAVEGDQVEVITEGSFSAMNVSVEDVEFVDETQLGIPKKNLGGPSDFGFLMKQG